MSWGEFFGSSKLAKGQAVLGGLLFLTGVVMVVGGVVLLALDCQLEKPWVLLVWGLVTCLMYGLVMWAGADRVRACREGRAPSGLVQGLQHLASADGATAWWFAGEIVRAWSDSRDMEDSCRTNPDLFAFVMMNVRFAFLALYILFWIGVMVVFCCKRK